MLKSVDLLCWLWQVVKQDGSRGLVPLSYIHIAEEDEDEGDVFSLAGRTDLSGAQSQAESATDFNSFLKGYVHAVADPVCGLSMCRKLAVLILTLLCTRYCCGWTCMRVTAVAAGLMYSCGHLHGCHAPFMCTFEVFMS